MFNCFDVLPIFFKKKFNVLNVKCLLYVRVYARLFSGHYMNMRNGNYSLSLSLSRTILLSAHTFRILEVSFSKNQFEIRNGMLFTSKDEILWLHVFWLVRAPQNVECRLKSVSDFNHFFAHFLNSVFLGLHAPL